MRLLTVCQKDCTDIKRISSIEKYNKSINIYYDDLRYNDNFFNSILY